MDNQVAGAFVIDKQIIFRSYVLDSYQTWVGYGSCIVKSMNSQLIDIGQAIVEALNESKLESDLEEPITSEEMAKQRKYLLKTAKVTSHRKLVQNSVYCDICRNGNSFEFTPTHNGGTRGDKKGHQFLRKSIVVPGIASYEELGSAFLECISLCTSIYNT